jgi:hypothetical protein
LGHDLLLETMGFEMSLHGGKGWEFGLGTVHGRCLRWGAWLAGRQLPPWAANAAAARSFHAASLGV